MMDSMCDSIVYRVLSSNILIHSPKTMSNLEQLKKKEKIY